LDFKTRLLYIVMHVLSLFVRNTLEYKKKHYTNITPDILFTDMKKFKWTLMKIVRIYLYYLYTYVSTMI
jgi:hypothetical protein